MVKSVLILENIIIISEYYNIKSEYFSIYCLGPVQHLIASVGLCIMGNVL